MDGTLGDRELEVMSVLWSDGPGTVVDVQNRLGAELAYNTVLTILRNLEQKGFVRHEAEGRLHRYFPAVAERAVRRGLLSRLVERVFAGSPVELVTQLVEGGRLSENELRELHQLLDSRVARGPVGTTRGSREKGRTPGAKRQRRRNP